MIYRRLQRIAATGVLALSAAFGVTLKATEARTPEIGEYQRHDQTLYVGIVNGQRMYTAEKGAVHKTFEEATTYCSTLRTGRYTDWRIPTAQELDHLVANKETRMLRAAFAIEGGFLERWYWSTNTNEAGDVYAREVVHGTKQAYIEKKYPLSVLCVRAVSNDS